jgi:hypothetical protein
MILENSTEIPTRSHLINLIQPTSIGCELGVFLCEYSDLFIESGKFQKFYLVDTFSGIVGSGDINGENIQTFNGDYLFDHALRKYSHNTNVTISKIDSITFLKSKEDSYFDFIYIDTIHTYDHLIVELEEALRVTKNNGLICGHDYNQDIFPGVVSAVKSFTNKNKFRYYITTKEKLASFIIVKN